MEELESESRAHRRAVLDKWSTKVRGSSSSLPNARGKLLGSGSGQQTITAVLDAHIATEIGERASKRSRQSDGHQEPVYDDTVFYQSLLRDLVEQRMSSSDAMTNGLDDERIDAVGYLIGVGAWSDRTVDALQPLVRQPPQLVAAAVNTPEYLTS